MAKLQSISFGNDSICNCHREQGHPRVSYYHVNTTCRHWTPMDPHRPQEDPLAVGGLVGDHWVKLEHLWKTHNHLRLFEGVVGVSEKNNNFINLKKI